jgi:orotate phosphoribosyltransferase
MAAMLLHRPLSIVRQSAGDVIDGGNGWRLETGRVQSRVSSVQIPSDSGDKAAGSSSNLKTQNSNLIAVLDDTVMTGNSLSAVGPIVRQAFPEASLLLAAVYVNPLARQKPDLWAQDLPWPHLLEWNLFNSVLSPHCAVDFDGILCHDCPPEDDDDGPRYQAFLESARPRYYIRRTAIPLIVTARLEKYRAQTLAWLARHGMQVEQLVMGPWRDNAERAGADIAAFKAQHFRAFLQRRHRIRPPLFIESDPRQARRIAELSKGIVVCPAAGRCFP